MIEKLAFVELGMTKNELDKLYEKLGNNEEVMTALEDQAAEKNLNFPLKEKVASVQYELRTASKAHTDWQPSKVSALTSDLLIGISFRDYIINGTFEELHVLNHRTW